MIKLEKQNSKYDWHVAFVKLGFFVGILFLIVFRSAQAQDYPYTENQDQHSFAQLYFGICVLKELRRAFATVVCSLFSEAHLL